MSSDSRPIAGLLRSDYMGEHDSGSGFHICVQVPDLEQALHFYRDLLGLPLAWRSSFAGAFLDRLSGLDGAAVEVAQLACPGGSRIELACYVPQGGPDPRRLNDAGLNHLSFGFHDVRSVYDRLSSLGVPFAAPPVLQSAPGTPVDSWWVTYCYDPWGTPIEMFGPADGVADVRLF